MNKEEQIQEFLNPLLEDDTFLVEIRIKPTNNVKVYLDADNGLAIERCIKINRALYKKLEEAAIFPDGDFSLEVSSPGVGEPLKTLRQYKKNVGRDVEVFLKDDSVIAGKLIDVNEGFLTLEVVEGKNKKAVKTTPEVPFENIVKTIVQIKF
ncbi:MAG: ribosome maturation factor [Bacteroidetes bacterium]|nr:ribosome maturation factor [Bacteroidota bacterium]